MVLLLVGAMRPPPPSPVPQDAEEKEVRTLLEQLDSEDLTQRDRARQELTAKGRKIVPLLRPFLKASSAEVASQVRAILERFEREERLERSLPPLRTVTIPKGRHTPLEIFQGIREQTGYRIEAYGVKMREPLEIGWDKVPVLRVLDELCRQMGRGRPMPPPLVARATNRMDSWHEPEVEAPEDRIIVDGEAKPLCATSHWNQFRAAVSDVVVTEQRSLKESSTQASLVLSISAQPGTHPIHMGSWEVEEVLDDRGGSLKPEAMRVPRFRSEAPPDVGESLDSVWFAMDSDWAFSRFRQEPLSIKPPAPEARRIARLKLKIRVSFAVEETTRTVKVKEIQAKGKETADFGLAGITFSQPELKDGQFHLHYEMGGSSHGDPALTLLDKDGTELRTNGGGGSSSGGKHQRHWTLRGVSDVDAIRVSAWIGRKTIEMPFEFSDIPLPVEP